jgi:hypothetical protein
VTRPDIKTEQTRRGPVRSKPMVQIAQGGCAPHASRHMRGREEPMSEGVSGGKARQAVARVREAMQKAEESTQKAIGAATPALSRSLEKSMEAASKAFGRTVKAIDGATASDQVALFRAYRRFLSGQLEFVDSRIKALEEKSGTG